MSDVGARCGLCRLDIGTLHEPADPRCALASGYERWREHVERAVIERLYNAAQRELDDLTSKTEGARACEWCARARRMHGATRTCVEHEDPPYPPARTDPKEVGRG